jgi:hypothetical protein
VFPQRAVRRQDLNNDGFMDIVAVPLNEKPRILRASAAGHENATRDHKRPNGFPWNDALLSLQRNLEVRS